ASTRHWNVDPASEEVNVNVETCWLTVPFGPLVIVVSGGVVSTGSVVSTVKVCAPSVSAAVVNGVVHGANTAASTRHWKDDPASVEVNENVGVLSLVV